MSENTFYSFSVAALVSGEEVSGSDNLYVATKLGSIADGLASGKTQDIKVPYSEIALSYDRAV